MVKVIKGTFGLFATSREWARFRAQQQDQPPAGKPDLERPPDVDVPNFDKPTPDPTENPGSPPFTGEDVEDIPKRKPQRDRSIM